MHLDAVVGILDVRMVMLLNNDCSTVHSNDAVASIQIRENS